MKLDISNIKYSLCFTCIEGLTIFLSSVFIVASIISPDNYELLRNFASYIYYQVYMDGKTCVKSLLFSMGIFLATCSDISPCFTCTRPLDGKPAIILSVKAVFVG